ncbi:MAG: ABC transporter ATP-binding protein [Halobacteriota archaeon]|nr:ABC transporter ATP-binding protein [Halobacteriota archaeon]
MIQIRNLSQTFRDFSLKNIDLDIDQGEYFVLLGPTGSGKTLLIESIAGLCNSKSGRIKIDGLDMTGMTPERRGVGYVPQDYALFRFLSVKENIEFGMKVNNYPKKEIDKILSELSSLFGLDGLLHRNTITLSGGESQRVAMARTLAVNPKVLLLDEPLSALDPRTQQKLSVELKEIHRKLKITTIHVTHNFEEAATLGDRIGVMDNGSIIQVGLPEEIFRKPKSRFVAEFVGDENLFWGVSELNKCDRLSSVNVSGMNSNISSTTKKHGLVHVFIRPEDIKLTKYEDKKNPCDCDLNVLEGSIKEVESRGIFTRVLVDVGVFISIFLTRRSYIEKEIEKPDRVYVMFKAEDVHVF